MLLRLIVLKKLLVALLLFAVALLSLVGSRRYDQLPDLLQELTESDRTLLAALVSRGLDEGVRRLEVTALVSGLYTRDCKNHCHTKTGFEILQF